MRLSLFRHKLLLEVNAARTLDGGDERFQPHLYCIAALLRKILTRIGDTTKIEVTILPFNGGFTEGKETLRFLSSRILHSSEFRIGRGPSCTIVSDRDMTRIRTRMIDTDDFLDAAKMIASDHETVLKPLIRHALTKVNGIVHGGGAGAEALEAKRFAEAGLKAEAHEVEALESLRDVFDLARMSSKVGSIHGDLTLWVVPSGAEALQRLQRGEELPLRPRQTSYSALVANLFRTWVPFPLRQWRAHPRLGTTLDFHGEQGKRWCITVDDLLAFLRAAERQWFKVGQ